MCMDETIVLDRLTSTEPPAKHLAELGRYRNLELVGLAAWAWSITVNTQF